MTGIPAMLFMPPGCIIFIPMGAAFLQLHLQGALPPIGHSTFPCFVSILVASSPSDRKQRLATTLPTDIIVPSTRR